MCNSGVRNEKATGVLSRPYLDEELAEIGSCGLDLERFELEARVLPRKQTLDIDGDDAADAVYPVRRLHDDARMLALCRAGSWLTLVGPEHPILEDVDIAHVVHALEAWQVVPAEHGPFGYVEEPAWPDADGDVLVLERIEKGMAVLFWKDRELHGLSIYRYVEP